jgi:uncharacterized Ntn-hydrolase superfamily protein
MTLCEEYAYDWFHDSDDNEFKTIQDLLRALLERFGDDQDETYNELVDAFMEKWKEKELPNIETINSDVKIDTSPDSIEELKEIIETMQFSHAKQCEAIQLTMNEQFEAMEDQLEIMEASVKNPGSISLPSWSVFDRRKALSFNCQVMYFLLFYNNKQSKVSC